jgi:SH3-like domain-containing protein
MTATARHFLGAILAGSLIFFIPATGTSIADETQTQAGVTIGPSGLPIPRYVSLKSNRVNVRKGPSTEHAVAWVFSRAGLPVEVIAEFDNWRQIRDSEGSEGWVFHALLSGRRTALVIRGKEANASIPLNESDSASSDAVAQLQPGVLGSVHKCDGSWCNFTVGSYTGWIQQERLWGVYPGEKID